ncbi:MAG: superoxide dismutase family protein [Lachnospiraceae bacterium]|nr:superoxide dismutase family protein [Lachnospiraceae bacterium]
MNQNNRYPDFGSILVRRPQAWARLAGSEEYPEIRGLVRFYQTMYGTVVVTEVMGLPNPAGGCDSPIFGYHIHEGGDCGGNMSDPFADSMTHYNPHDCPHPYHAGDLPPLFGAKGYAFAMGLTDRFQVDEIVGKTVIIHASPDDFTTQPSGNSGAKIACGVIQGR